MNQTNTLQSMRWKPLSPLLMNEGFFRTIQELVFDRIIHFTFLLILIPLGKDKRKRGRLWK